MEMRMSGSDPRNIRKVGAEGFLEKQASAPASQSTAGIGFHGTVEYVCEHVACLSGAWE